MESLGKSQGQNPRGLRPEGFGLETSEGLHFTMIHPRLIPRFSLFLHPELEYEISFGQWTPNGVHCTILQAWTANIDQVKSQYTSEGCIKNVYQKNFQVEVFWQLHMMGGLCKVMELAGFEVIINGTTRLIFM